MTLVAFGRDRVLRVGRQFVSVRQKWGDPWQLNYDLHCLEVAWALSPTMPTATLNYDYGFVQGLAQPAYVAKPKLNLNGWYVKIVLEMDWDETQSIYNTNTWYGVIEHIEDEHRGLVTHTGATI
ncbi:MAG: hypothetical protein WC829_24625, partial [Hyphomicrobium sp.]